MLSGVVPSSTAERRVVKVDGRERVKVVRDATGVKPVKAVERVVVVRRRRSFMVSMRRVGAMKIVW